MTVLAIDTSSETGSVAMWTDGAMAFSEEFGSGRRHSTILFAVLERALADYPKPDRIAVGLGPGSHAGVRVAISAAIGISIATGAELLGIPSIAALPLDAAEYRVVGDARRGSFYLATIRDRTLIAPPVLIDYESLSARESIFTTEALPAVPEATLVAPSAAILAELAAADRGITARNILEPLYLRPPHITPQSG